ncbi:unannotated protein [freshwater metagenome]|uniref:Unannotated protein n=1 Tax=freshwater metagenome TaxID=449393 RepID=A0A6J7F0G3_9ZZZZ|nr:hypothetical protein [Actinomycetota bacterium]
MARAAIVTAGAAPRASVTDPFPGQHVQRDVSGKIAVGAFAESSVALQSVSVLVDNALAGTVTLVAGSLMFDGVIGATATAGTHTVTIEAVDTAGGTVTSSQVSVFVDVTAPTVTLGSTSLGLDDSWGVGTNVLIVNGTVDDDGVIVAVQTRVGDGQWRDVIFDQAAKTWSGALKVLNPDGKNLPVSVRAFDRSGRQSELGGSLTVDFAPVGSTRAETTLDLNSIAPPFNFTGTKGTKDLNGFTCSLDGQPGQACASGWTVTGLAAGTHRFEVAAVDVDGLADLTPAVREWTVTASGPQAVITSGPDPTTDRRTATFAFGLTGATFQCALDSGAFASCVSPVTYTDLADGTHTFQVRALRDGTTGTAVSFGWRVVNTAPVAVDQNVIVRPPDYAGRAVTLVARDVDPVSYRIVKQPEHGFLEGTPPNVTYVPFRGYAGPDRFTFEADDSQLVSGVGTVDVLVGKVPATLTYTGTSGLVSATSITLSGSVSPNGCSAAGITYKVNDVPAQGGGYTITAGNLYEIEMSYSDPNCEAPAVYAVVLAGSTAAVSNGGGQYRVSSVGTINFGYTVQANEYKTSSTQVSGQMLWNSQNGKFRFKGNVTGFVKSSNCAAGSLCRQIVGIGTLRTRNDAGQWIVVGSVKPYKASVIDGGSALVCTRGKKPTCTAVNKPDFFGLDILGTVLTGEQTAPPGGWPAPVKLSSGNLVIKLRQSWKLAQPAAI